MTYLDVSMNWNTENPLGSAVTVATRDPKVTPVESDDIVIENVSEVRGTWGEERGHMITGHMTYNAPYPLVVLW